MSACLLITDGLSGPRWVLLGGSCSAGWQAVEYWPSLPSLAAQSGDIWLARANSFMPGVGLFVVLPSGEDALISEDKLNTGRRIRQGEALLVEIVRPLRQHGIEFKGARASIAWQIAGVLARMGPSMRGVGIARDFPPDRALLDRLRAGFSLDPGEGVVLSSAAAYASPEALGCEIARLRATIQRLRCVAWQAGMVEPAYRPDPWLSLLRLAGRLGSTRVIASHTGLVHAWHQAIARLAAGSGLTSAEDGGAKIFAEYGIADQIDSALSDQHRLGSSAWLTFEPCTALTAIDVNTGNIDAGEANRLAAWEIARLARLRRIGGPFVVDFATPGRGGRARRHISQASTVLSQAFAADPAQVNIARPSSFGLIEFVREERLPRLTHDQDHEMLAALDQWIAATRSDPSARPYLAVPSEHRDRLAQRFAPLIVAITTRLGREVALVADNVRGVVLRNELGFT